MANASISDWRTIVSYYAKGADQETTILDEATLSALRNFCRFTNLWKENLDRIDVVADTARYTVSPGTTYCDVPKAYALDKVQFKEDDAEDTQFYLLDMRSREQLQSYDSLWEFQTGPTPNKVMYDVLTNELVLVPTPTEDSDEGLLARVMLMPGVTATTCPEFFLLFYKHEIAYGAAGYLLRQATQRWYNRELGDYYWNLYMNARMNAQQDADIGFTDQERYNAVPEPAFTGGSRHESNTIF